MSTDSLRFGQFGMHAGEAYFNAGSGSYRCCCLQARTCLLCVAAFEIIIAVFQIYDATRQMLSPEFDASGIPIPKDDVSVGVELGSGIAMLSVALLLLIGLRREMRSLLVPHLVWTLVGAGLAILYLILFFLAIFANFDYWPSIRGVLGRLEEEVGAAEGRLFRWLAVLAFSLLFLAAVGLQLGIASAILTAFRYLRDKRRYQLSNGQERLPLKGYS